MDTIQLNKVAHSNLVLSLIGQPESVAGKIGGALELDGSSQFMSLEGQSENCLGNLDFCRHGVLLSAWIKPGELLNGMDLLSTGANGLKMWYEDGKLKVSARTSTREWNVETEELALDLWQFVEIAWDERFGLAFYIFHKLVAFSPKPTLPAEDVFGSSRDREQFYIGRGDGTRRNAMYGILTIDDVEYWYANRQYLLAFDYIQRGGFWCKIILLTKKVQLNS